MRMYRHAQEKEILMLPPEETMFFYRWVHTVQREEMEPAAAMVHTRLACSSIPEPTVTLQKQM